MLATQTNRKSNSTKQKFFLSRSSCDSTFPSPNTYVSRDFLYPTRKCQNNRSPIDQKQKLISVISLVFPYLTRTFLSHFFHSLLQENAKWDDRDKQVGRPCCHRHVTISHHTHTHTYTHTITNTHMGIHTHMGVCDYECSCIYVCVCV